MAVRAENRALLARLEAYYDAVPRSAARNEEHGPLTPVGISVRMLDPDDADLAAATAVAHVAFSAAGTAAGRAGPADRDLVASGLSDEQLEARRARMRERPTATAAATDADGPLCVGSHQPVGDVSEIVGVGTLPAARRRGLAAAVTSRLVEDADARGVEVVFLSAGSEEIARVYGRLGFRRIGTACMRSRPPSSPSRRPSRAARAAGSRAARSPPRSP
jgi:ribosomal protein S18 acetylase RimI-like enzyme